MGFDIGGALSGIWNATVGSAVKAVSQIFAPPAPPEPAPTMAKDESVLRHSADWEVRASLPDASGIISDKGGSIVSNSSGTLISNSGGTLISNSGGTIVSNSSGTIVSNSSGTFKSETTDFGKNSSTSNPNGGVLILTPDGNTTSHDISINHSNGTKTTIDQGVITYGGDGSTTIGDKVSTDGQGNRTISNPTTLPGPSTTPR